VEIKKEKRTLAQAMLDFRVNVDSVTKDGLNPHFGSNFASYNAVQEAINPTLDMLGMVVIQAPNIVDGANVLNTKIYLADNPSDMIESNLSLLTPKGDMQQLGGAITYARRYSLLSLFGLATEDDDGNQASEQPTIPAWENKDERQDIIVDVKLKVDEDELQEAIDIYLKRTEHKDNSVYKKRKDSVWSGLGNEYKTKISLFRRQQEKEVA
jgi:hypothetical protein